MDYKLLVNLKKIKKILELDVVLIFKKDLSILIDTSPDIKNQFLKNKINTLDAIIYTHEHADQTTGIFEMRPFFGKIKKKSNLWIKRTITELKDKYTVFVLNKEMVTNQL